MNPFRKNLKDAKVKWIIKDKLRISFKWIRPTYCHYAMKYNFNLLTLKFNRYIYTSPLWVTWIFQIIILGFGFKIELNNVYKNPWKMTKDFKLIEAKE